MKLNEIDQSKDTINRIETTGANDQDRAKLDIVENDENSDTEKDIIENRVR